MKTTNLLINILKLAVLSGCLFYMIEINTTNEKVLTELRKSNKIESKQYLVSKKLYRVNASIKLQALYLSNSK